MKNSKNLRARLLQKSSTADQKRRRRVAATDLQSCSGVPFAVPEMDSPAEIQLRSRLTKLLLNVTIRGSLGAVQVIMSPESTVSDLISAALRQYSKEGRRPISPSTDPATFGLHYSQFCLQSLDMDEKLTMLGSRNFFLCPKTDGGETTPSTCSADVEKVSAGFQWPKLMDFLL